MQYPPTTAIFAFLQKPSGPATNIGLGLPGLSNPYLVGVAKDILERSRKHDVAVLILDTKEDQPMSAR